MIHYKREMPEGLEREPAGGKGQMTFLTLFRPEDLEGKTGMFEDGRRYPVSAGDIEYCPKGHSHGIENLSDRPMTFLALQFKY